MKALEKTNIEEIQKSILCLEGLIFSNAKGPVKIEKLNPESFFYDVDYDSKVRGKALSIICLLDEIMRTKGGFSKASQLLNQIEVSLDSPEFYRDIIFWDRMPPCRQYIQEFCSALQQEIEFLELKLKPHEYKSVRKTVSSKLFPADKDKFILSLKKLKSQFAEKPY